MSSSTITIAHTMLHPILAMVVLTAVVLTYMAYKRFGYLAKQMKTAETDQKTAKLPEKTLTRVQMSEYFPAEVMYPANNFQNLFEVPVLFYVLCIMAELKNIQDTPVFGVTLYSLAWVFVLLRVVHSYIHCTYNKLPHRLFVFVVSTAVVFVMTVNIAILLL